MTRLSQYFLPTEKQPPADAEALSHKLLVRAGMIRQVGAGLWSWLPAGWRVHQKAVQIVREELDAIGAQEMLMPVLNPAELWQKSGRYDAIGGELFRLKDRRGADMVLAMTHEEVVTSHVAQVVRSYRDLPLILYHFQTKERDEPRPRAGVLRTREFIMKDSYTFDRDAAGLDVGYDKHREAYDRIFDRCGLEWYRVDSDVGMMGGTGAHEYMAPCPAGENDVALAPGYAANVEVASATPQPVELPEALDAPEEFSTPGATTIEAVATLAGVPAGALIKAYPIIVGEDELRLVLVRGDHKVNDIKLGNALGASFRPAHEAEFEDRIGPAGFIGPVGVSGVPILLDAALDGHSYIAGANKADAHLRGVDPARDFEFTQVDVRSVVAGDTVDGHEIRIEPAIEIGNIFKLGTRYSVPLGATYLDEDGQSHPIWMGSYGIGPARICAAAVEQFADEKGISWPRSLAPFDIHLVGLGKPGTDEAALADKLYDELRALGLDVIYDDREGGPGAKFADAELLGCPLRLTIGKRTIEAGEIEAQVRRGRETRSVPLEGAAEAAHELWKTLP
ncbi:proline--tRNA ligase [Solirubrobacter sp. CPCC 204708]|uniref:Proline--tRNA ligase n=1 Tax=Solirubrobacter deserti TaxID=2282478 RepID=A0ABT4RRY7_9ACTN|nr:proline--tRNA ligase [Solirubrobacter deserti]MBE2315129.1 proline--tRNA ligase [Solirubrobacter deserti]MDA0141349.1 proline--tRNA ligase [Solirubrobacter deserti]